MISHRAPAVTLLVNLLLSCKRRPSGCLEVPDRNLRGGYGRVRFSGKSVPAHRFIYTMLVGAVRDDLFVCHTCDNRRCVEPSHLWIGTLQDNNADKVAKGRQPRGMRINTAKIPPDAYPRIMREYKAGASQREIGVRLGVTQTAISRILRRNGIQSFSRKVVVE